MLNFSFNHFISIASLVSAVYLLSLIITFVILKLSYRLKIIDVPNARSMHTKPVPRTGGLAIIITFIISLCFLASIGDYQIATPLIELFAGTLLIAIISFIDDCKNLSIRYRFAIQLLATLLIIIAGFTVELPSIFVYLSSLFTVLFILWVTNLYNFMDGLDGFASGMTVIGFGSLGVILLLNNHTELAIINIIICAATFGVLTFNFPPAKIFLGDVGSASIGFFTAGMAILLNNLSLVPLWQSIIIFSPFIADATYTILKRFINQEQVFQPHRTHFYQRLALLIGHTKTVLLSYILMISCSAAAIYANQSAIFIQCNIIFGMALLYIILITLLELKILKPGITTKYEN